MNIKDMRPATGHGKTVAYFKIEFTKLVEGKDVLLMTVINFKLIEGKNGLFVGVPQQEYVQAGVKKWKDIIHLERAQQDKVNAAAIEAYRLLGGAAPEPEPDISW